MSFSAQSSTGSPDSIEDRIILFNSDSEDQEDAEIPDNPFNTFEMLDQLPIELIELVVSHVDRIRDLRSLARSNKLLQDLAEPRLYKNILIRKGTHATALQASLAQRPVRGTWIRSLRNACQADNVKGISDATSLVPHVEKLKDLLVETPDCNTFTPAKRQPWLEQQERYKDYFLQAAQLSPGNCLQNLRSCTLHFVDEHRSLYHLGHFSLIFLHPRLEKLTISCANIDSSNLLHPLVQEAAPNTTPLTSVSLIECDFNLEGLHRLLSLPRELKSLTITEATHYASYTRDRRYTGLHARDCLHPIQEFQTKLSYLKICRLRSDQEALFCLPPLDLSPFTELSTVEFSHVYNLRGHPIQSACDACDIVHRSGPDLNTGAPKTTTLIYNDLPYRCWERGIQFFICAFKHKASHGIENLRTLKLLLIDRQPDQDAFYGSEIQQTIRKQRADRLQRVRSMLHDLGTIGQREDINIRVIADWKRPASGTIPPYLVGEAQPQVVKGYDSLVIPRSPKNMPQAPPSPRFDSVNGFGALDEVEA